MESVQGNLRRVVPEHIFNLIWLDDIERNKEVTYAFDEIWQYIKAEWADSTTVDHP